MMILSSIFDLAHGSKERDFVGDIAVIGVGGEAMDGLQNLFLHAHAAT